MEALALCRSLFPGSICITKESALCNEVATWCAGLPVYQNHTITSPFIDESLTLWVVSGKSLVQVIIHLHCQVSEILKEKTALMEPPIQRTCTNTHQDPGHCITF